MLSLLAALAVGYPCFAASPTLSALPALFQQDDLAIAQRLGNQGQLSESAVHFRKALADALNSKQWDRYAAAAYGLAWTLERLQQYSEDLAVCDEAIRLLSPHTEINILPIRKQRIFVFLNLGQLADHKPELDALLADCLKGTDLGTTLDVYRALYSYHILMNEQIEALEVAKAEVDISKKLNLPYSLAAAYENLSSSYGQVGFYDESIAAGLDSLALLGPDLPTDTPEKRGIRLAALEWVATGYAWLGQLDPAEDYFNQMLKLAKGTLNANGIGSAIVGLGLIYTFEKRFNDTIKLVNEGLGLSKFANNKVGMVLCNAVLCYTMWQLGENEKALKYADDALAAAQGTGDMVPYYTSISKVVRSAVLSHLGRSREAVADADDAHAIGMRIVFDPIRRAMYDMSVGLAHESAGEMQKAEDAYREMIELMEGTSKQVQDASQLGALQQRIPNPYGFFAFAKFKNLGAMDALLARERGRARGLARQIALTGDGDYSRYFQADEATRLRELLLQASAASAKLRAAQARSPQVPAELAKARADLEKVESAIEDLKVKIYARNPRLKELHALAEAPPSRAVLERMSRDHPDTAYVEWALIDRRHTLLILLVKGQTTCIDLPVGEYAIDDLVQKWHDAIARGGGRAGNAGDDDPSKPPEAEDVLAKRAYDQLLAPVAKLLEAAKVTRLVFVPDGNLADMPFAALMEPSGKRLIERYAVSQAVSLGVLTWKPNPFEYEREFFCVADTTSDDGLVAKASRARAGLGPLPFARKEGMAVAKLFPGVTPLVGPDATEERVRAEMGKYRVLHFACHGSLEARDSLRNGLVLAAEPAGSAYDGILQSREIIGMKLCAQLTVLSACDTGRGTAKGGDGLQSVAWAFRAANCPSVIASHWQVDDEATGAMMTTLYGSLAKGLPKDKALQAAALKVMQSHRSPYYWAAFDLIGDTSPLIKL